MQKTYLAYNRMGHRYMRGTGAPVGTPSRAGLRYLDTTTGLLYLSRNVLNFNNTAIAIPQQDLVRKVSIQFWHNEPSPSANRLFYGHSAFVADRFGAQRTATTGTITSSGGLTGNGFFLDGVSIGNGATNPSANVWHSFTQVTSVVGKTNTISISGAVSHIGKIASVQIFGASDLLLASYAIDEGTGNGSTIYDSSGNGNHGTLTLGSGSWGLEWMLADTSIIQGVGAPTGTPIANGLTYLDTSANKVYRSRNVLNASTGTFISVPMPQIQSSDDFVLQTMFWKDPAMSSAGFLLSTNDGTARGANIYISALSVIQLFGATTNPSATLTIPTSAWAMVREAKVGTNLEYSNGSSTQNASITSSYPGQGVPTQARIAQDAVGGFQARGKFATTTVIKNGVVWAIWEINEGTGTTIFDSSGNGRNGTLTLGSGNWELSWVPL